MAKTKLVNAEIVVRAEKPEPKLDAQAMLDRIIRQRVDEILADRDAALFEPDFRPKAVATEIIQRQSVWDRRKWATYFDAWGCRRCDTKKAPHFTLGYCHKCFTLTNMRLRKLKADWIRAHPQQPNIYRNLGADPETQEAKVSLGQC